jgi:chlorinating enzyme
MTHATIDKTAYARDGYLSDLTIFSPAEAAAIQARFDELEAREGKATSQVGLINRHETEAFVWELASHPRILDVMAALVGEDLLLIGTHFFCKYPSPDAYVAWHQDVTYWGLEPQEAHTAWLSIDGADVENGCMRVIPGSHTGGILEHRTKSGDGNLLSVQQHVDPGLFDVSTARDVILAPGQMSVHHGVLLHGSNPNRSTRRRCGLTLRYVTPNVKRCGAARTDAARGPGRATDRCGRSRSAARTPRG